MHFSRYKPDNSVDSQLDPCLRVLRQDGSSVAEDRAERRRKLGLPEHLTSQEEAAERAKQAEREATKRRQPAVPPKPVTALENMRQALVQVKKQAGDDEGKSKTAYQTLLKYVGNIAQARLLQRICITGMCGTIVPVYGRKEFKSAHCTNNVSFEGTVLEGVCIM